VAQTRSIDHLGDFTATPRMLYIAALALPIGAAGACLAWLLLRLIGLITNAVFYQRWATTLVAPGRTHHSWALLLLAPVAGGLVVGLMARFGSEKIRGHGMPEAIEAILLGGSRVAPRVAVLKPVSAALAIGTGGPFGAEGPIIMTGGAVGSLFAQLLHLTADERKTLLVSGAAAGMAATFNAPLASLLLAVELLLFEWRPRSLVPVTAAVSVAAVLRAPLLGHGHVFVSTALFHLSTSAYLFCVLSGLASALLAVGATSLVYAAEDLFARLPVHWMWWPAIGGLIIGAGGIIEPHALGVGYDVIGQELAGSIGPGLVVSILVVKTLIWSLSLGSGTSGGVLAPMFMIGGALGALEAQVFPHVGAGFWPLIGLAGVLGGVMRSPFTGIVFAVELTGRFDAVLPLIIGTGVAFGASVLLLRRSVLTEKIARRGNHLTREYDVDPLEALFVDEVLADRFVQLDATTTVRQAHELLLTDPVAGAQRLLPVVDSEQALVAIVTENRLTAALTRGRDQDLVITHAQRDPVCAHGNDTLRQAALVMADSGLTRLVVTDRADPHRPVGVVSLQQLLEGRLRDLHEQKHPERLLTVRLPRLDAGRALARRRTAAVKTEE
jgi:H+/Cl- antiporter ClcA/CBS domain-containing protein